jgi:hypothetical protein
VALREPRRNDPRVASARVVTARPRCYASVLMADFVTRAVLRLREDPGFSRNRYFLALSSPEGQRALRIHRHLRSLERDLAAGWQPTVSAEAERVRLTLRRHRASRVSYLTRAEFKLLCGNPEVRAALGVVPDVR